MPLVKRRNVSLLARFKLSFQLIRGVLKGKPEVWLALIQKAEISGIETGVLYAVEMRLIAATGFEGGNNMFVDVIKLHKAGG